MGKDSMLNLGEESGVCPESNDNGIVVSFGNRRGNAGPAECLS